MAYTFSHRFPGPLLQYAVLAAKHQLLRLGGIAKTRHPSLSVNFAMAAIVSVKTPAKGGNTMAALNISMPDEMRALIEARVSTGEYQSASDYLRDLIRHDREETERLLVEGLESGAARPLDMATLRKRAQASLKQDKAL